MVSGCFLLPEAIGTALHLSSKCDLDVPYLYDRQQVMVNPSGICQVTSHHAGHIWRAIMNISKSFSLSLIAASLLVTPAVFSGLSSSAQAQQRENQSGFYVSAYGGLSIQQNQSSLRLDQADFKAARVTFDPGFSVGGSIGYRLPATPWGQFRLELDLSYRENSVDNGIITDEPGLNFSGDNSSLAGMAVVMYDFTNISRRFIPSDVYFTPEASPNFQRTQFGGPTDTEFAWQAIIGVTMPLNRIFDLFVDGRYYSTGRPDWLRVEENGNVVSRFRSEFDAWHLNAGVRFKF
jgi:opacity protein-like surface antigen